MRYPSLYPNLNEDPFAPGGVMDAPDEQVSLARMKLQLGHEVAGPLTPYEVRRLNRRTKLEAANSAPNVSNATAMMRGSDPGGIDVNSYTGSIWNGTAQPIAGYRPQDMMRENSADALLRRRFGAPPNERGQIDVVGNRAHAMMAPFTATDRAYRAATTDSSAVMMRPQDMMREPTVAPAADPSEMMGGRTGPVLGMRDTPHPRSIYSGLQGTQLDPHAWFDQQLKRAQEQELNAAKIEGQQLENRGRGAEMMRPDIETAAINAAYAPVTVPGENRTRTVGEGLYYMGDSNISTPATTRPPSAEEMQRGYLTHGGRIPGMAHALMSGAPDPARDQSPLAKMIADHNRAVAEGRAGDASFLKQGIQNEVTPKGMSLTVGPDGAIQLVQGPNNLTTGTTTDSQKGQYQAERIVKEGAQLLTRLRSQDIGAAGVIKEEFVNKALAQLDPSLADQTVTANRTALRTWRESTLRHVSSDTRFSNADRVAVSKLLPEDGIFESLPSAQAKMLSVLNIMKGRAGMEAARRGEKSIVELPPEELVAAAKAGKIPREVAAALLHTLHPEFVDKNKAKP